MATKSRTAKTVATLERSTRLATARHFTGKRVEVVRRYVGNVTTMTGTVVCAAVNHGGGADVLVLQRDGRTLADAYSLAQVLSIVEL